MPGRQIVPGPHTSAPPQSVHDLAVIRLLVKKLLDIEQPAQPRPAVAGAVGHEKDEQILSSQIIDRAAEQRASSLPEPQLVKFRFLGRERVQPPMKLNLDALDRVKKGQMVVPPFPVPSTDSM